jgi:hypothetical protein
MGSLDLVGIAEAAEILDVPASRVKRWQTPGRGGRRMPPTVATPRATPVWVREDVVAMRDGATEFPQRDQLPLLGFAEVAEELKRDRTTIGRWRRAGNFPAPSYELRAGPLWMRSDIAAFDVRAA